MSAMSDVTTMVEEAFDAEGAESVSRMLGVLTEIPDWLVREGLSVATVIDMAEAWQSASEVSSARSEVDR